MKGRNSAFLAALFALAAFAAPGEAAVVCQKGKKVRLRADACKAKETTLSSLGGGALAGTWELTGGAFLAFSTLAPEYLVLEGDGSGSLHLAGGDGPRVACAPVTWSSSGDGTLVVDDWGFASDTRVYRYEVQGNALELTDAVGSTGSFERVSTVDPALRCEELVQLARFGGLPPHDQSSGLVFDGSELWYKEDDFDRIVPVDPTTGAAGTPLDLAPAFIHAAQGADFWGHCNCGRGEDAIRLTRPGTPVDTVHTDTELGDEIAIEAIAYQPAAGALWLHGWNDAGQGRLLKVAASGEPDVLLGAFDLDARVRGMTVSGNSLWALDGSLQSVIRISTATGAITGTFLIPDRTATWRAIAAADDQLFLVGNVRNEAVVLVVENPD